jgi:ribosomal protein L28
MTAGMLNMINKTASVLRASDVSIVGDGSKITAVVGDKKNATGNSFSEPVGDTDKTFKVNLKVENLKMLPGDYAVSISSKKISRFKSPSSDLVYYVAVEADSTFEF